MFKKNIDEAAKRLMEEQLYSAVADELKNKVIREGLMAKALVEASGDKEQARLIYMQYWIQSMLDEAAIKEAQEESARREQAEQRRRLEVAREIEQQGKAIGNAIGKFFQIINFSLVLSLIFFIILALGLFFWDAFNR